jgi:hypothetical protein
MGVVDSNVPQFGRTSVQTSRRIVAFVAGIVCTAGLACAGSATIQVIALNMGLDPRSQVPGGGGLLFQDGVSNQFGRPILSPNGQWLISHARFNNAGSSIDNELVMVMNPSINFTKMVAREGSLTPFNNTLFYGNSTTTATIRRGMGINNSGQYAFAATVSGPSNTDDVITRWSGTAFSAYGREGTPSPIVGVAAWGSDNGAISVLEDGRICGRMANISGVTSRQIIYRGTEILCESSMTIPADQRFAPNQTVKTLTAERFRISASGNTWLAHGTLNGSSSTNTVMLKNNVVLAQAGSVLAGSGFTSPVRSLSSSEASQSLSPSGEHWAFRGFNADGQDWVVQNGAVIATRGGPVTPFGSETVTWSDARFSDTFFMNIVNDIGDTIIGGMTNDPDESRDAVLVYDGMQIVVREGEFVDLNGDGLDDDDLYIATFNNDAAAFTADGMLFFTADLKDSAGVIVGQGLLSKRVFTPCPCSADFNQSGGTPDVTDISAFFDSWLLGDVTADVDCSGGTPDSTDIEAFFTQWLAGGC